MGFTSLFSLALLSTVVIIYYLVGSRLRWVVLLLASYGFYAAWKPSYLLILAATTAVNYFAAVAMGHRSLKAERRKFLWFALAFDLGALVLFKYAGFLLGSLREILPRASLLSESPLLHLVMPLGISFYTLQTIGYMLDVYHGRTAPERHVGVFAVYVSFFPIVLSGPIERARHLLPQLRSDHRIALVL